MRRAQNISEEGRCTGVGTGRSAGTRSKQMDNEELLDDIVVSLLKSKPSPNRWTSFTKAKAGTEGEIEQYYNINCRNRGEKSIHSICVTGMVMDGSR